MDVCDGGRVSERVLYVISEALPVCLVVVGVRSSVLHYPEVASCVHGQEDGLMVGVQSVQGVPRDVSCYCF